MLLGTSVNNILRCNRNVTRVPGRRPYTWSDTAGIEIFIHRQNQVCFHNRFLFSIRGYVHDGKGTPPRLAFALQKLSILQRVSQNCAVLLFSRLSSAPSPQRLCQRVAFGYDLSAQRQELLVKKETALRCVQAIRKSEFEIYVCFIEQPDVLNG